jgi:hypothetical protein
MHNIFTTLLLITYAYMFRSCMDHHQGGTSHQVYKLKCAIFILLELGDPIATPLLG